MLTFTTRCPVVKKGIENLWQFTVIGGERKPVEFQREIIWIQKSETTIEFVHGGKVLRTGGTCNDHYGYCSSMEEREGELGAILAGYSINRTSSLVLQMRTEIYLQPAYEDERARSENTVRKYLTLADIPFDWRTRKTDGAEILYPGLESQRLASEVVWSSKNTEAENARIKKQFIGKWAVESIYIHPGAQKAAHDSAADAMLIPQGPGKADF